MLVQANCFGTYHSPEDSRRRERYTPSRSSPNDRGAGVWVGSAASLWQARAMASALSHGEAVRGALDDLDGRASFVFGLLIVERLARVAEEIFPRSLPESEVSYRRVRTALDDLWARLDDPAPAKSLASRVRRWGPVDETGQVSAGEGTSLAYLIGFNVGELAVADLDAPTTHPIHGQLRTVGYVVHSTASAALGFSGNIHGELDGPKDRALAIEYDREIADLNALLHGADPLTLKAHTDSTAQEIARALRSARAFDSSDQYRLQVTSVQPPSELPMW
jgi:hypothetical protein